MSQVHNQPYGREVLCVCPIKTSDTVILDLSTSQRKSESKVIP
jgi:hypothetical protein